jgi:hypothetical protein
MRKQQMYEIITRKKGCAGEVSTRLGFNSHFPYS